MMVTFLYVRLRAVSPAGNDAFYRTAPRSLSAFAACP